GPGEREPVARRGNGMLEASPASFTLLPSWNFTHLWHRAMCVTRGERRWPHHWFWNDRKQPSKNWRAVLKKSASLNLSGAIFMSRFPSIAAKAARLRHVVL